MQTLILLLALSITPDSQLVIDAGKQLGVQSIRTGTHDPTLQFYAEQHAAYMASVGIQGHQGWDGRFNRLNAYKPGYLFQEIAAESWPWQDQKESAPEMFKSWRQSPGHWAAANGRCDLYGYAMARGRNGIYYGCGIVGRRR